MRHRPSISNTCTATLAALLATALLSPSQARDYDDGLRWTVQAGAVYQPDTSLDSGGDASVSRWFASAGASNTVAGGWVAGLTLGFGEDRYDFSGSTGFGSLDPWGTVRELRVSAPIRYFADEHWTLYAIPSIRFNSESGASLGDGQTAGVLAGISYRVSDTLSIGPGLGVMGEIEDDTSFFPILLIDWQLSDRLSLETASGFAASRGPGIQLRWQYSPNWQFAVGGRYEKTRFRLDDSGPAPDGVGEDEAIPLFALASYSLTPDLQFSLIAGAELNGRLRLEDRNGSLVEQSDLSDAAFFGASFKASF